MAGQPFPCLEKKSARVASGQQKRSSVCALLCLSFLMYIGTPLKTQPLSAQRKEVSSYCSSWRASDRVAHRAPRKEHVKGSLSIRPLYHFTQKFLRPKGENYHGSQKTFI
jgi:hypothetical protein